MPRDETSQALFERSGSFETRDPVVSFLYELMRDHVPPGVIEGLVQSSTATTTTLTNGWLASYAVDVAKRLRHGT